jgi:hypothetical protein
MDIMPASQFDLSLTKAATLLSTVTRTYKQAPDECEHVPGPW